MKSSDAYVCTWCKGRGTVAEKEKSPFRQLLFSLDLAISFLPLAALGILGIILYAAGMLTLGSDSYGKMKLIGIFGGAIFVFVFALRNIWQRIFPRQIKCPSCNGRGLIG